MKGEEEDRYQENMTRIFFINYLFGFYIYITYSTFLYY